MNLFTRYTFSWQQIGLIKLTALCFGIAIGAYWQELFQPYLWIFILVAVTTGGYVGLVWLKQSK